MNVKKVSLFIIQCLCLFCCGYSLFFLLHHNYAGKDQPNQTHDDFDNTRVIVNNKIPALVTASAYFSPDDDIQSVIIEHIKHETKHIICATYRMTDKYIITALLDAYKRGVQLTIITDQGGIAGMHNKLLHFMKEGIPLYVFPPVENIEKENKLINSNALMHNKFFIFFSLNTVITGSYNCTTSASKYNQENIVVLVHKNIVQQYHNAAKRLLEQSTKIKSIKNY